MRVFLCALALVLSVTWPQAQTPATQTAPTDALPVRRVVLYKSGVGYFEHVGRVRGNQVVTVDFTSSQLDDVLKSITALDLTGGRVSSVQYNSSESLERRLGTCRCRSTASPRARSSCRPCVAPEWKSDRARRAWLGGC
jgi:hypothetical protein